MRMLRVLILQAALVLLQNNNVSIDVAQSSSHASLYILQPRWRFRWLAFTLLVAWICQYDLLGNCHRVVVCWALI